MEKNYEIIGPGTAGVAQRISLNEEIKYNPIDSEKLGKKLYILKGNKINSCGQNQY